MHHHKTLNGADDPLPTVAQEALSRVFGQSATLTNAARQPRKLPFDDLGAEIDKIESAHKQLSAEQQSLINIDTWGHPYLLRGVAGSGKSIVMAYQVAKTIIRHERRLMQLPLFAEDKQEMPKIAVVCLNRTLVPLLQTYIESAYENLAGKPLKPDMVTVAHLNGLIYELAETHDHFHYIPMSRAKDKGKRSREYLAQLDSMSPEELDELRFDALYLDEGAGYSPRYPDAALCLGSSTFANHRAHHQYLL